MGFDLLTVATTPNRIDAPIIIVGIDEPSFAELNQQWPWPRKLHAHLVDTLKAAGAKVIAFDVLFAEPSTIEDDTRFAEAIKQAGNIVLASEFAYQNAAQYEQVREIEPLPLLREAGARVGIATISFDQDLVVRNIPLQQNAFWREVVRAYFGIPFKHTDDGLQPRGNMMRYLGSDHVFQYVSYYQASEPDKFLRPGLFKNKIVLVGNDVKLSLGPGAKQSDAFATPYSGVTRLITPGVEIQATMIANALSKRAIREAPLFLQIILIGIAVMLTAFGVKEWQALRSTLLAVALIVAIVGLTVWLFAAHDIWLPSVAALLAVAGMYITQVGTGYLRERRQRKQTERAFRHYVAPEIVKEMTEHPERLVLGGVRRDITLMFTDLVGFTSISEQMKPEVVASLLNEFLTIMARIVLDHGGTVDKFIGDAIMAFWGAPLPDADQARHACQAAQAMQAEMLRLRERLVEKNMPQLHMRIGIHSGAAVVGNMGSSDRFDYTAVGDAVNFASRLEGVNKHYRTDVLISGDTAAQVKEKMSLRRVDRVIVQGKTQPMEIYTFCDDKELAGLSDQALSHYLRREWQEADTECRRLLSQYPHDTIARLLLDRIEFYRRNPPAPDWNGSTSLDKL